MKFGKYRIIPLSEVIFDNTSPSTFDFYLERDISDLIMMCNLHLDFIYQQCSQNSFCFEKERTNTYLPLQTKINSFTTIPDAYRAELQAIQFLFTTIYDSELLIESHEIIDLIENHRFKFKLPSNNISPFSPATL